MPFSFPLRSAIGFGACLPWFLRAPGAAGHRVVAVRDPGEGSGGTAFSMFDFPGDEAKCEDASATARKRCGFASAEDVATKCHACNGGLNKFSPNPNKTEHLQRQLYNYCPRGELQPLEGKFHRFIHPNTQYHYVDEGCNCWTLLQIHLSVFHNPLKYYKFVRVNEDCSSMEAEVPRSSLRDDCRLDTSASQGGSFNYFDPGYSKLRHTTADVVPCELYGIDYDPPERPCRPLEDVEGPPSSWTF